LHQYKAELRQDAVEGQEQQMLQEQRKPGTKRLRHTVSPQLPTQQPDKMHCLEKEQEEVEQSLEEPQQQEWHQQEDLHQQQQPQEEVGKQQQHLDQDVVMVEAALQQQKEEQRKEEQGQQQKVLGAAAQLKEQQQKEQKQQQQQQQQKEQQEQQQQEKERQQQQDLVAAAKLKEKEQEQQKEVAVRLIEHEGHGNPLAAQDPLAGGRPLAAGCKRDADSSLQEAVMLKRYKVGSFTEGSSRGVADVAPFGDVGMMEVVTEATEAAAEAAQQHEVVGHGTDGPAATAATDVNAGAGGVSDGKSDHGMAVSDDSPGVAHAAADAACHLVAKTAACSDVSRALSQGLKDALPGQEAGQSILLEELAERVGTSVAGDGGEGTAGQRQVQTVEEGQVEIAVPGVVSTAALRQALRKAAEAALEKAAEMELLAAMY
jgi:hypothetical protein